jgi:hypothetical protein
MSLLDNLSRNTGPSVNVNGGALINAGAQLMTNATQEIGKTVRLDQTILGNIKQQEMMNARDVLTTQIRQEGINEGNRIKAQQALDINEQNIQKTKDLRIIDQAGMTEREQIKQDAQTEQKNDLYDAQLNVKELESQQKIKEKALENEKIIKQKQLELKHDKELKLLANKESALDREHELTKIDRKAQAELNATEDAKVIKAGDTASAYYRETFNNPANLERLGKKVYTKVYRSLMNDKDIKPEDIDFDGDMLTNGEDSAKGFIDVLHTNFQEELNKGKESKYYSTLVNNIAKGVEPEEAFAHTLSVYGWNNFKIEKSGLTPFTVDGFKFKPLGHDKLMQKAKQQAKAKAGLGGTKLIKEEE